MEPDKKTRDRARIFKALGHPTRLMIFQLLARGEKCVGDIVEKVPGAQATTSRHLSILVRAGVLRRRRERVKVFYSLAVPCLLDALPCVSRAIKEGRMAAAGARKGR